SSSNGAGIYHAAGTLKIASGDISCNSGTAYSNGGGIYFAAGASIGGGTFSNGYAKNGGGLYIKSGVEVTLAGGATFTQNEAASTGNGGAIYQGGTFNMSGAAYIAPGSEKTNDVYLASGKTVTITGALNPPSGVSSVATISLGSYSRGRDILSSTSANAINLSNAIGKFKLSQDDSGWDRGDNLAQTSETAKKVWITSPIYVVGASGTDSTKPDGFEYGKTTGANGTKSSPYASVADALTCADLADIKEITVAGTLVGAQQEIASPSVDITLKGYKAAGAATSDAKIQRWSSKKTSSQDAGSVLIVNASGKTVTITDLTLSYGASSNGGGIYITNGTVKLGDYAKISENYAGNKGGGVYVSSGATLFMYGKALIGDKLSTDTGITTATGQNYGNAAPYQGGGGIYNEGSVYIGYNGFKADGTTLQESVIDAGYGIIRCFTMNQDGGAIYNNGTLKIKSGSISYNRTVNSGGAVVCVADATISGGTFESNYAGVSGGAVSIKASKTLTINGDAIFKNNQAESGGGAISNLGTLTMTAGTIGESGALNRIAEGKTGSGGAISQNGTFNISGTAYIYPGSEKSNDVYLTSGKSVAVDGSWSGSQSSSSKMTLTPPTWKRGTAVVTKGSSSSAVDITTDIVSKFSVSDSEWSAVLAGSGASAAGKIDAEIWLSSSDETDATRSTGVGQGSDSNSGTKSKPYATLNMAVAQCWKGPNDTVVESGVTKGRTIHIDGTAQAPSGTSHMIPQSFTTSKASAITLLGSAKSGSTPTLKAADKQVLQILTYVPVRIQKLKITGASTSSEGAGIYAKATGAKLTLGEGAEVSGNTTTGGQGGGVWFGGTGNTSSAMGTLIMESTAKIQGNVCGSGNGGGIYLKNANLYMTGSALVGDNSSYDTGATRSSYSNLAQNGGGIFADENAAVYIGYASDGSISEMTSGYGVCHNYAKISGTLGGNGGGIFLNSSTSELYMGSGSISKNGADENGGGIWNGGKVFLHTNAKVGDTRTSCAKDDANSNVADGNGGGIYSGSGSYVALGYKSVNGSTWTEQTLNDGYGVLGNYALGGGGGVFCEGASGANVELRMASGDISANCSAWYGGGGLSVKNSYGTVYMSGGKITKNKAQYGGGVHLNGTMYMSGSAAIGDMSMSATDYARGDERSCSNYAASYGGGVYLYDNGYLYMGYKDSAPTFDSC
ncbi:MAG: hypothetical protein IJL24_06785, partial [Treponema sp.]|nr:hypothetical protein [Treponema sp.]